MKVHILSIIAALAAAPAMAETMPAEASAELLIDSARDRLLGHAGYGDAPLESAPWRLTDGLRHPDVDAAEPMLKVKLRPNRAMGRMSLSF